MKHPYVLLDEMLHEAHQVQKLVQEQAEALAAVPAHRTVYSTPSLLLGLHTPTLLLGIHYSGAFKKGRKLKSPGQRKDYPSYDSDAEGNLLRITHHDGSLPYTHYFYRRSGREWAVPLFRSETSDQYCFYPYYTFFTEYDPSGRIRYFGMVRGHELRVESYRYDLDSEQFALCDYWQYIPTRIGSVQTAALWETGSPAQLWRFVLDLSDPKHISGKKAASITRDDSARPPVTPAVFWTEEADALPQPDLYVDMD